MERALFEELVRAYFGVTLARQNLQIHRDMEHDISVYRGHGCRWAAVRCASSAHGACRTTGYGQLITAGIFGGICLAGGINTAGYHTPQRVGANHLRDSGVSHAQSDGRHFSGSLYALVVAADIVPVVLDLCLVCFTQTSLTGGIANYPQRTLKYFDAFSV